ncbi:MAG: TetR/AcrR family transcriptional regulator [Dysosmobacter sp.]|nr:TetR/AcrR family transcriptional regulator [Dysosmobacter sp.]
MKREEKNQQTKRRIMDSALAEFAQQGYGASSVNTICSAQGISKGIIYHYFKTKDELYLACVEECFEQLTEFLRANSPAKGTVESQLEGYFSARVDFFRTHPVYQPIFCEAVISPPAHLTAEIQARKQSFDDLNIAILENLLQPLPLRPGVTMAEVVDTFRRFQDFINANDQAAAINAQEFSLRDQRCKKALNILLYGVIAREDEHHV